MSASILLPALLKSTEQECYEFVASHSPGLRGPFVCKCAHVCKCVVRKTSGMNSRQWTVIRAVAVWGCVRARCIREDTSRSDDNCPPLLLLTAFPLGALNVLDCLGEMGGVTRNVSDNSTLKCSDQEDFFLFKDLIFSSKENNNKQKIHDGILLEQWCPGSVEMWTPN